MPDLGGALLHVPLVLLMAALILAGVGLPVPEDLVPLSVGATAHGARYELPAVIGLCWFSVLAGDTLLFSMARRAGAAKSSRGFIARLLPEPRRARLEQLFARRGAVVVFAARHVAGLRAPVFALAGVNGMPLATFLFWDALGACISVPVVVLLGHAFADHIDRVRAGVAHVEHWAVATVGVALAVYAIVTGLRRLRRPHRPGG